MTKMRTGQEEQKKKRRSIKRYITQSNTVMVLVMLLLTSAVFGVTYAVYSTRHSSQYIQDTKAAEYSAEVYALLSETDMDAIEEHMASIANQLKDYDFYVYAQKDGQQLYSTLEVRQEDIEDYIIDDGEVHLFVYDGVTILSYQVDDVILFAFNDENIPNISPARRFWNYFLYVGIAVAIFILLLAFVSGYFTKKLNRRVMEPLDQLTDATNRMRDGDYQTPIYYKGDYEFEDVCRAFDAMQQQIATDERKKVEYEKSRTTMLAGISHDLKTPLTAIQGTLKGLLDGVAKTPEMEQKFLTTAYRRSLDMSQLLDQLFYFSKMETGTMPIELQDTNWVSFLGDYIREREALKEEAVHYFLQTTGDDDCSRIDPKEMKRILDNLVENSKKYAKADELVMQFHLSGNEDEVLLWVSDNGGGIAEEKLPHIFEAFYRGDESRNEVEGNGLGLHIVRYLTEAMNGTVTAQNDDGLMICFTFPAVKGGEDGA